MGLTSLFADMNYEMANAILPFFIMFAAGGNAAVVGLIEGISDGTSSFVKSYSGYHSDISGKRTPIMYVGYSLTTFLITIIGFTRAWIQVLFLRVGAWVGKGARGPPRDALMVDSTTLSTIGKAFGLQSALDTTGAIIGPAIALLLIPYLPFSKIFFISMLPGIACMIVLVGLVREIPRRNTTDDSKSGQRSRSFSSSIKTLPIGFKRFLGSAGLFGIANFSNLIFSLRAEQVLQPSLGIKGASQLAVLLYLILNVVYAASSFPVGYLADKVSKRYLLASGYLVFALACVASIFETPHLLILLTIFILAGLQTAVVDTVERAYASELIHDETIRGTAYGVLQTVNGIGDFVSSAMIGVLWTLLSPAIGFTAVAFVAVVAMSLLIVAGKTAR
jgi:MFS family permease